MCAEIAKNKFSDIGLASSKGRFFERPNKMMTGRIDIHMRGSRWSPVVRWRFHRDSDSL